MENTLINQQGNNSSVNSDSVQWRVLHIVNIYRICLCILLFVLANFNDGYIALSVKYPDLFKTAAAIYFTLALIVPPVVHTKAFDFAKLVIVTMAMDIIFLCYFIQLTQGYNTGLGLLINIVIASCGLMLMGRVVLFLAALASILLLIQQLISIDQWTQSGGQFFYTGLLGASFFATAILAHVLSKRLRDSIAFAQQCGQQLQELTHLNEIIIQRMRAGIIVLNDTLQVQLINEAACDLLGYKDKHTQKHIHQLCPELNETLDSWENQPQHAIDPFQAYPTGPELNVQFTKLENLPGYRTIIYLDDVVLTAQHAQHMKLASLGRFTASIAHELRNPLGAIGHAVQLLQESSNLTESELRLANIIYNHTTRMNTVIKNILQISRRKESIKSEVVLKNWLQEFSEHYIQHETQDVKITIDIKPEDLIVYFDLSQLHQVLTNLVENGLRYSLKKTGKPTLTINCFFDQQRSVAYMDVIDQGDGIQQEKQQHIFEPFYTTERNGTGLGLYLARELCEANNAKLDYVDSNKLGACFRVTFHELKG